MLKVHDYLKPQQNKAILLMQVHDELVLEVHKDALDEIQTQVIELMTNAATLDVPLRVDAGIGKNWDEAH